MIEPFGPLVAEWQQIIVFISIASMVLGAFAAIGQTNIKRLMAYSSIGHVGYALIGLAAGGEAGIRGVLIYMAIYLFMNLGTFAVILCMRQQGRMVEGISDLAGPGAHPPGLALALAIFMFSHGRHPAAGRLLRQALHLPGRDRRQQLYTLAVIGVCRASSAAFYYMRIVKVMYFDEPGVAVRPAAGAGAGVGHARRQRLHAAVLRSMPAPLFSGASAAAAALFAG